MQDTLNSAQQALNQLNRDFPQWRQQKKCKRRDNYSLANLHPLKNDDSASFMVPMSGW